MPRPGLEFNAERRAVLDMHAQRTHELAAAVRAGTAPQPTLVIWPENSTDIDPYRNADANAVISAAAQDIGVPILVGAVVQADTPGEAYNMGIVWDPVTGPGQTYTKRHPLPFGEYMPYRSFFRIFSDKVDLQRGHLPARRRRPATSTSPASTSVTSSASRWSTTTWSGTWSTAAPRCWWCRPTTRPSATPTRPTSSRR